jgi:hypothetical protein
MAKLTADRHRYAAAQRRPCEPKDFGKSMLADLVDAGLASRTPERVQTGRRRGTIAHLRITEAGLHMILNHPRALWSLLDPPGG